MVCRIHVIQVGRQVLHNFQLSPARQFSDFLNDDRRTVLDTSSVDNLSDLQTPPNV